MKHTEITKEIKWLGDVINIWDVGTYQFYEYKVKNFDTGEISNDSRFGCVYKNELLHHSFLTLEEIFIFASTYPKVGPNKASFVTEMIRKYIDIELEN